MSQENFVNCKDVTDTTIQDGSCPHLLSCIFRPEEYLDTSELKMGPPTGVSGAERDDSLVKFSASSGGSSVSNLSKSLAIEAQRRELSLEISQPKSANPEHKAFGTRDFEQRRLEEWSLQKASESKERFKQVPKSLLPMLLRVFADADKEKLGTNRSFSSEHEVTYTVTEPESDDDLDNAFFFDEDSSTYSAANSRFPSRTLASSSKKLLSSPLQIPSVNERSIDRIQDLVLRCKELDVSTSPSKGLQMPYYDNEQEWRNGKYIYDEHVPYFSPPDSKFTYAPQGDGQDSPNYIFRPHRSRHLAHQYSSSAPATSFMLSRKPPAIESSSREMETFDFETVASVSGEDDSVEGIKNQKGKFQDLMPELLDIIFGYLPRKALLSVALTSKFIFIHAARHLYRTPPLNSLSTYSKFLAKLRSQSPQLVDPYLCHVRVIDLSVFHLHGAIVTDSSARLLARGCGDRLRELNLTGCQKLTEEGGLDEFIKFCPNISSAVLNGCINLTDRGLARMAKSWANLESLSVLGCRQLTNKGLKSLFRHCHKLQSFSVSFAKEITGRGIVQMARGPFKTNGVWMYKRHSVPNHIMDSAAASQRRGEPSLHSLIRSPPGKFARPADGSLGDSDGTNSGESSLSSGSSGDAEDQKANRTCRTASLKSKRPLDLRYLHVKACGLFSEKHLLELAKLTPKLRSLRLEYNVGSYRLTKRALMAALAHWSELQSLQIVQPLVSYTAGVNRPEVLDENDINTLLSAFINLKHITQKPNSE